MRHASGREWHDVTVAEDAKQSASGNTGPAQRESSGDLVVRIERVSAEPSDESGVFDVTLHTNVGDIGAALRPREGGTGCVIFIGIEGPGNGVYLRLSRDLLSDRVTSLHVRPRIPGELEPTVLDVLAACSFMKGIGAERAVITGHSYAGAVAIKAGELTPLAAAVAATAPQRHGTQTVDQLGKPLLLVHGADDQVLLWLASDDIYQRAKEPKRLVLLEGTGHSMREVGDELYRLLREFIVEHACG